MIERYALLAANTVGALAVAEEIWLRPTLGTVAGALDQNAVSLDGKKSVAEQAIHHVRQLRILADWDGIEPQIGRLEDRISWAPHHETAVAFRALNDRVRDELDHEFFFRLDRGDVPLYGQVAPFGVSVAEKFPGAADDIKAAGNCLALHQATACVFHLMRVMELGVQALARKLNVTAIDPGTETWGTIVDHINVALNSLPAKVEAQKQWKAQIGSVIAHLNAVRIATRNEVMHPKQTYTREQGHEVFNATRIFMRDLAGLV